MTAPTRPADHYCGVCRYAVDHIREDSGRDWYRHTASYQEWTGPGHEPVPVPLVELTDVNMVCDICSAPDPALAYRFARLREAVVKDGGTTIYDYGDWWIVCKGCAGPVDRRDVAAMVERAALPFRQRRERVPDLAAILTPVYAALTALPPFERLPAREVRW